MAAFTATASSVCYQINHPFEDIEVKRNADTILDDQLRRRRNKAMINTGSMCDPYIPLELKRSSSPGASLEVIARHGFGAVHPHQVRPHPAGHGPV